MDVLRSETADRIEASATGGNAMVWDEVVEATGDESRLSGTFLGLIVIACLLAAVGVAADAPVTIVGAMVVSPDFGPLAAIAVGVMSRRPRLIGQALTALLAGFGIAMVVTAVLAWLLVTAGLFDPPSLSSLGDVAFVYDVGPASFLVALLAGAAGMLALTSQKSGALIGVFISVTTVPAAGFASIAAVAGRWEACGDAVLQLLVNIAGVLLAAVAVLAIRLR